MMLGPNVFSRSIFGTGARYGNITGAATYDATTGTWTVTGAATVDISAETGSAVLMCKRLVVNGGVLTVSTNCKGLLIFASVSVQLINGGKINIDRMGKAGNFGNLTPFALLPAAAQKLVHRGKLLTYVVQGSGASGGDQAVLDSTAGSPGHAGAAAGAMQTGGGGSGNANGSSPANNGLAMANFGGIGGPCCGGAASGSQYGAVGTPAGSYGGPGGNSNNASYCSAGPGDPPGTGGAVNPVAPAAGGGLMMIFAPIISIASGFIVSADGAPGSGGGSGVYPTCSGGAGGGCVVVVTKSGGMSNLGTIRARGGAAPLNSWGAAYKAGDGGLGSVNIFTIS
jgi:hypothetical protein